MEGNEQLATIVPMLEKVVSGIEEGQLGNSTPCSDFDVAAVLGHMTTLGTGLTQAFLGRAPADGTGASSQARSDSSAVDAFRVAMDGLLAAVQSPGALERTIEGPAGPMPGAVLARLVAFDGLVHGWDLAKATQQVWDPSDDLVAAAEAFVRQALTPEMRGNNFGPALEAPDAASALERLIAFSGREV